VTTFNIENFADGDVIFTIGDPADHLYILSEGKKGSHLGRQRFLTEDSEAQQSVPKETWCAKKSRTIPPCKCLIVFPHYWFSLWRHCYFNRSRTEQLKTVDSRLKCNGACKDFCVNGQSA
jgi:hypothetical protein